MKKLRKIAKTLLIGITLIFIGNFSLYIYSFITPKMEITKANMYYLYDNKNDLVFNEKDWVSLNKISPYVLKTTIAVEDKNFYHHFGFDYLRIIKAMGINITKGGKVQGASTITQQYARNLFLDFSKTWNRKIEEALLAIELEVHYSKDEILEGYLNTINYGGVFGIENASNYYFNKSSSELTIAESAMLVGIPKSPSKYSPLINEEKANERQHFILRKMLENKIITKEEYSNALNEKLSYVGKSSKESITSLLYYQDAVIDELYKIDSIPNSLIKTGGLKIYTTLDKYAQECLDNAVKMNIPSDTTLQAAGIMMDPKNGEILALIGGTDYYKSQFNRAINSLRQIGSTVKPFLYYAALENGFTAASSFTSEKTIFTFSGNQTYSPKNYNDRYPDAPISMGTAISYSDNIYAVKTHLFLGEEVLVDMLRRVGITTKLEAVPSLALGSSEFNMLELTSAYATFASEGYKTEGHFIRKIEDSKGNVLYEYHNNKEVLLNRSLTFILNELLTSTYDTAYIDYNYPTVISMLPQMTKKYSIKSGTTATDLWIIGYNKEILTSVWLGYDDNKAISKSDYYQKDIWLDATETYLKDKTCEWYQMPNNVVGVLVNPLNGKLAEETDKKKKIFYFIKGTEPYYTNIDLDSVFKSEKKESD